MDLRPASSPGQFIGMVDRPVPDAVTGWLASAVRIITALLRATLSLLLFLAALGQIQGASAQQNTLAPQSAAIELSAAERAWLAANHTVRVRVADYPPYLLTRPAPSGMAVDYLAAVARRFGFKFELLADEGTFAAAAEDVKGDRQRFDLLPTFTRTPEREKQFAITVDYLSAPWVLFARRDSPYIMGIESLRGKTIVGEKGFVITERIKSDFPDIRVREMAKSADALLAVATGEADGYVGNLAYATYLIKANHLTNLVVAAPTPYGLNSQGMAVRKDWPELASLIDKGIATMSAEERNAITQKWGATEIRARTDYTLVWQVCAASALVLLAFFYWNRKLAQEIVLRKAAELSAREGAAQLEAERRMLEQRVDERTALLRQQKEELEMTLGRIKRLEGMLPICMHCKKIRTEHNDWHQLEQYIGEHSDARFSHGICPECLDKELKGLT